MILNAFRRSEGFNIRKNTLSDTMDNGISFSMGTFVCGASTVLLSRLARDADPHCDLGKAGTMALEVVGYAIGSIGVTKWAFKSQHDGVAGVYFIGAPISLALFGIDQARHGSKAATAATMAAAVTAALSFVAGYDRSENTIPAAFEASHAIALAAGAMAVGAHKFTARVAKKVTPDTGSLMAR